MNTLKDIFLQILYLQVAKKKYRYSMKNEQFSQKIHIFGHFDPITSDRLYRWIADNNRPINRSGFCRLIGRLIGIGRTLLFDNRIIFILPKSLFQHKKDPPSFTNPRNKNEFEWFLHEKKAPAIAGG